MEKHIVNSEKERLRILANNENMTVKAVKKKLKKKIQRRVLENNKR